MTTTEAEHAEAEKSGGFVVGKPSVYVVGLEGEVTAHTDGTVSLCGFTLPTRLNTEGGVRYLSTEWPADPISLSAATRHVGDIHDECVSDEEFAAAEAREQRLIDGIVRLHDENHPGPITVCLHEVCRRADGRW